MINVPDSKSNFAFTRINVYSLGLFKIKIRINLEFKLNIVSGAKKNLSLFNTSKKILGLKFDLDNLS